MHLRNIRLLLVEDCPSDIWLVREALRLNQFPVDLTVVCDGVEASRYLHQVATQSRETPDLLLLDLNLPRRNGRELLADIKRSRVLQSIPVVILSSSSADEEKRQAFALKAAEFLTKPNSLPAYVEMVHGLERFWLNELELPKTA